MLALYDKNGGKKMKRLPLRLSVVLALALAATAAGVQDRAVRADEVCGEYGTSVIFADSPAEAAKQALKEEKLVFVLHVSGVFEESGLT